MHLAGCLVINREPFVPVACDHMAAVCASRKPWVCSEPIALEDTCKLTAMSCGKVGRCRAGIPRCYTVLGVLAPANMSTFRHLRVLMGEYCQWTTGLGPYWYLHSLRRWCRDPVTDMHMPSPQALTAVLMFLVLVAGCRIIGTWTS